MIDKQFHATLHNGCNYLFMWGLELNHVCKGDAMAKVFLSTAIDLVVVNQTAVDFSENSNNDETLHVAINTWKRFTHRD